MPCQCDVSTPTVKKPKRGKGLNVLAGTLVLLIPKCAMCWTAYLGLLGWAGVPVLAYRSWFIPVAVALFGFTLVRLFRRAMFTRRFLAFSLALVAAALIGWEKLNDAQTGVTVLALALMITSWFADLRSGKAIAGNVRSQVPARVSDDFGQRRRQWIMAEAIPLPGE